MKIVKIVKNDMKGSMKWHENKMIIIMKGNMKKMTMK